MSGEAVYGRRVYLSGPMSGRAHYNAPAFTEAHAELLALGATWVYDPAIAWLRESEEHGHAEWIRRSLHELTRPAFRESEGFEYEVLVSMPGWESSEGARVERAVAEACGIEVADLADVLGWGDES